MANKSVEFYNERDKRTISFLDDTNHLNKKIGVVISKQACQSFTGQLLAMTLLNQLCRVHRKISILIEDDGSFFIKAYPIINETKFSSAIQSLSKAIDPYGDFQIKNQLTDCEVIISIGNTDISASIYVGCRGTIGILSKDNINHIDWSNSSKIGAGMASTLAAAAILREVINKPVRPIAICAWNYEEVDLDSNNYPKDLIDNLNLGNSLIIGAGAVGSAFAY